MRPLASSSTALVESKQPAQQAVVQAVAQQLPDVVGM
jgi:hypothetical protein